MTAPARITQADIERALKSTKVAGLEHFWLILHLERREIEIIVGDDAQAPSGRGSSHHDLASNEWDDE